MAKGLISRGVAGVAGIAGFPAFVFMSACGGNTDAGASPEADEPNLSNESRTLAEPNVNTGAVDRNGNDQSAASGSSTSEVEHWSAAAAPTTEASHGEPASTHTAVVDTIAFDGGVTGAGSTVTNTVVADADGTQANLECANEGCETACEAGFVSYPDLDAGRCLKVCDLTNLLPLDNQDKVAALAAQQCAVIEEGLTVSGAFVNDLTGLETIRRIGADFVIQDTALSSLGRLSNLARVGGTFVVSGNGELIELGFTVLENMGAGGLVVLSNAKLETLGGLASATFPTTSVTIVDNAALLSLDGLQLLTSAATLVVAQNASLTDVSALNGLGSVDNLTISENARLPAFELSTLSFATNMTIASNPVLQSVFLRCVGATDVVTVQNNPELVSLMIPSLVATSLSVSQNPKLPQCSIQSIIDAAGTCSACDGNDIAAVCEQE